MTQQDSSPLRIVLAGSVSSSRRTLQGLLRHRANVVGVLGLSADVSARVSDYARLDDLANEAGIPYLDFRRINDPRVVEAVRRWSPDLFFVVGLSQLVGSELLSLPRLGCVGFHPTRLPEGRGRAPIAWLTLEARAGAATFFLMDVGTDSGPILVQEPIPVSMHDYAADVVQKMEHAIDAALDRWLPRLLVGEWNPLPQCHEDATYYGRRAPEDGLIDWSWSAEEIHALIRATSRPYPGAYTYVGQWKLIIWRADIELHAPFRGVIGRIVHSDPGKGFLVQTGRGLLWLTAIEFDTDAAGGAEGEPPVLQVGMKLAAAPQDEIYALKQRIAALEERLARLEQSQQDG